MLCGSHNHHVVETLVGHPHVGQLKTNEKIMLDDMKKSMIKPKNSLLILKEHNEKNVTTISCILPKLHDKDLKEVP